MELGVELSPQGNIAVAVTFQLPDVALQLAQLFTHCPLLQGRIIFPVAHVETSAANFHPEDSVAVQQDAELRQDAGALPADDPAADESTVPLGCAAVRLAAAAKAPHSNTGAHTSAAHACQRPAGGEVRTGGTVMLVAHKKR